ncbi:Txe/YoeB family addiction module toxin [Bacteroidia bacterium]|nr:Txe/YoeB family addiction module toxin [Bacteroidia bacterium]
MEIRYSTEALADIDYWKRYGSPAVLSKISALINSIEASPFVGLGKPEALKYNLAGKWSRRINKQNRIVYKITDCIEILSLRGHYE